MKSILRSAAGRRHKGKDRLYLNIGHTGLNDPGFSAWVGEAEVRPIYFVHDLIPLTHPEYCRAGEQSKHAARMRTVLETGAGVIGNSQATLDELSAFGKSVGLPIPPAVAAWLGTEPLTSGHATAGPDRPTFVILGTIEARKNHLMLLQVWQRLIRRLGPSAPRLLIIGQRGWECEQVFDLLDRGETPRDAVIELGNCSDEQLAQHFGSARALLFSSMIEGYGLPLVEALQAGTPVIASDLPVFREIGGNVPDYLDPLDGPAWEQAILDYADDASGARAAQLKRLAGFHPPTWKDHFSRVEAWMETL